MWQEQRFSGSFDGFGYDRDGAWGVVGCCCASRVPLKGGLTVGNEEYRADIARGSLNR